jgi:choline dehydrogenase-like flavoprotein
MTSRYFESSDTVDFVIVGSGASGGVIARELSTAGFTVVVMEQGPRLGPGDFEHDELKYNFLSGITNDPKISPQTFRVDASQKAEQPHWGNSLVYARIVGGSSAHYTANFWRFHEKDFKERSLLGVAFRAGDHISQFAKRNEIQRPPLGRPPANVNQNDAGAF